MGKIIDMTGKRFGRLTVIERVENNKHGNPVWRCQCECGKEMSVLGGQLRHGIVVSCGCYNRDIHTIHGDSKSRLYNIWIGIKKRTTNSKTSCYKHYGGRGIKICDLWMNSYEAFRDWSIINGYSDDLTIDRINNDLGYSPENCQWVTIKEQANNTRRNKYIEYNRKTQTLMQWCEELELDYNRTKRRLQRGWTVERAFEKEFSPNSEKQLYYKGQHKTLFEWCSLLNLNYDTIRTRIYRSGWSIDQALETAVRKNK